MDTLNRILLFADQHQLLCWLVATALLNAAARAWPWLSQTWPGRAFAVICAYLGADPLGLLKAGAAGTGAKALHVAAGGSSASPSSLTPAAPVADPSPPTPRDPSVRPSAADSTGGRRS